jgi:cytochrome oxidase Cu insertion factor (SCO1/SenC/PrrC family)
MISRSKVSRFLAGLFLGVTLSPSTASARSRIPPGTLARSAAASKDAGYRLQLTNQDGKPFQFKNSRGKLVLASLYLHHVSRRLPAVDG